MSMLVSGMTVRSGALQGMRSLGKLGARAVLPLGSRAIFTKSGNIQDFCPEELKKLEKTSQEIQKLTNLLKQAALTVDSYNKKGIERTLAKSEGIVQNLHVLTLSTLESLFTSAEKLMCERELSEAMNGFKRVIDFGRELGSKDQSVNQLVAKALYLSAVSKIAMHGHEDEVVQLLEKSIEFAPELKEAASLLHDIKNSHWALHKAMFIAQYGTENY